MPLTISNQTIQNFHATLIASLEKKSAEETKNGTLNKYDEMLLNVRRFYITKDVLNELDEKDKKTYSKLITFLENEQISIYQYQALLKMGGQIKLNEASKILKIDARHGRSLAGHNAKENPIKVSEISENILEAKITLPKEQKAKPGQVLCLSPENHGKQLERLQKFFQGKESILTDLEFKKHGSKNEQVNPDEIYSLQDALKYMKSHGVNIELLKRIAQELEIFDKQGNVDSEKLNAARKTFGNDAIENLVYAIKFCEKDKNGEASERYLKNINLCDVLESFESLFKKNDELLKETIENLQGREIRKPYTIYGIKELKTGEQEITIQISRGMSHSTSKYQETEQHTKHSFNRGDNTSPNTGVMVRFFEFLKGKEVQKVVSFAQPRTTGAQIDVYDLVQEIKSKKDKYGEEFDINKILTPSIKYLLGEVSLISITPGTGVTAIHSFLQSYSELNDIIKENTKESDKPFKLAKVQVLYSMKTEKDFLGKDDFEEWEKEGLIDLHMVCSRENIPNEEVRYAQHYLAAIAKKQAPFNEAKHQRLLSAIKALKEQDEHYKSHYMYCGDGEVFKPALKALADIIGIQPDKLTQFEYELEGFPNNDANGAEYTQRPIGSNPSASGTLQGKMQQNKQAEILSDIESYISCYNKFSHDSSIKIDKKHEPIISAIVTQTISNQVNEGTSLYGALKDICLLYVAKGTGVYSFAKENDLKNRINSEEFSGDDKKTLSNIIAAAKDELKLVDKFKFSSFCRSVGVELGGSTVMSMAA